MGYGEFKRVGSVDLMLNLILGALEAGWAYEFLTGVTGGTGLTAGEEVILSKAFSC